LLTTRESASGESKVENAKTQQGEGSGGHENDWTGGEDPFQGVVVPESVIEKNSIT